MVNFMLTLVRHGLTDANQYGIIQGQMDEPLNDFGRRQAAILGQYLKSQQLTHVFSSDLSRTKETADLILKHFLSPPSTILDERLRERKYGAMEGQTSAWLKEFAMKTNTNVLEFTPDGAETLRDLSLRVISFFQDLCLSLMRQFSSSPSTPHHSSSVSRRASRASILNTWLEEAGNVVGDEKDDLTNRPSFAKFYVDDPVVNGDCSSSQDSGISGVFSADTLTIDTVINQCNQNQTSFPDGLSSGGRSASSLSPTPLEWPPRNISSPTFASQTVAACKINGDRHNRKVSMQSIASDDSNYPDIDAHVLVVSHGGPIREMIRYLVEELGVSTPGGKGAALRPCPNTGFSTFFVSVEDDATEVSVTCLNLHSKDHLLEHNLIAPVNVEAL